MGGATIPWSNPTKRIDYIFYSSGWRLAGPDAYTVLRTNLSDHLPVLARLEIGLPIGQAWPGATPPAVALYLSEANLAWASRRGVDLAGEIDLLKRWLDGAGLPAERVTETGRLAAYPLVLLANARVLSTAEAQAIREYVMRGGRLLAMGEIGMEVEPGGPVPYFGSVLADVLGVEMLGWAESCPLQANLAPVAGSSWPLPEPALATVSTCAGPVIRSLYPSVAVMAEWRDTNGSRASHAAEINAAITRFGNAVFVAPDLLAEWRNREATTQQVLLWLIRALLSPPATL